MTDSASVSLSAIADFLDGKLNVAGIPDYPGAMNGIQLSNSGSVWRTATAVDFSSATIRGAIDANAQLLIVHHGMFWGGVQPITAHRRERLRLLLEHDVAVYSAHLPLDIHPRFGNNALLAHRLGLTPSGGFARYQTVDVGLSGTTEIPTRTLADRAAELSREFRGSLVSTPFAQSRVTRRWGMCTGSGAESSTLREAADRGLDTLIVGEGPHHSAIEATELDIVVLYAGHYATETFGVRALGAELATTFGVPSSFIDVPSGL